MFTDRLKKNHPESVIHSESVSIADAFTHITPLSPLPIEIFESVDSTMENDHVVDTTQREVTDSTLNTISKETGSDASEDMEVYESRDIGSTSTEICSSER